MRNSAIPVAVVFGVWAAALPALAHHSHGAFYDACIPVTVDGMVETVEWKPPHVLLDLKTEDGAMYQAEWTSPENLSRRGIGADTVKAGERIVVIGAPLRPLEQLPEARRPAYRDLNLRILDVLQIRSARGAWSWSIDPQPTPQNCSRGFTGK